ncbi:hypothetical protein KIN20_004266 [Parelaphostrongylus tenuis]|uniref:Uncharacterized protein n=1 Tax=Parelaphostrongylus tenuis TaxID=148309 RepID=A0AAD5LYJ2_PARTN|nr:hypothetical protein KIN20_004266 [Parelaphostrongylus tenuis]
MLPNSAAAKQQSYYVQQALSVVANGKLDCQLKETKNPSPVKEFAHSHPNLKQVTVFATIVQHSSSTVLCKFLRRRAQPLEQAGLCKGFGCMDCIYIVPSVIKVCWKYCMYLLLTFIHYDKALDNIETCAVLLVPIERCRHV